MMRSFALFLAASSVVSLVFACGSADRAALPPSKQNPRTGGASSTGGMPEGGSGGTALGGGGSGGSLGGGGSGPVTGGSDGSGGTDTCPSDANAPPLGTFVCAPDLAFESPVMTTIPLDGGRLLAASSDELSFVTSRFGSSTEEFAFAERADTSSDFGVPLQLLAAERPVGMAPDGLTLFVLAPSGQTLYERTRSAAFEDFGAPDDGVFDQLNDDALAHDYTFQEVVVSSDGMTLVYAASNVGSEFGIFVSTRSGNAPWPVGVALPSCEFGQKHGLRRKPLALSTDGLTFFYFDEVRGSLRGAYRESLGSDFTFFRNFPGASWMIPNATCDAAYIWNAGDTSRVTKVIP